MLVTQFKANPDTLLDRIEYGVRALQADGLEPKYLLVGKDAYEVLRAQISARFNRPEGWFETYQFLPIVVDPLRTDEVCVLPAPREIAAGVQVDVE